MAYEIDWRLGRDNIPPTHFRPFYTFLIKAASRCNIDCTYCYVYQSPDQSWRSKPKHLSQGTFSTVVERIREHVTVHGLKRVDLVFHGGEPLLLGAATLKAYFLEARDVLPCEVGLGVQTNGILLDSTFYEIFDELNVNLGISIDGPKHMNDRSRIDSKGLGTFEKVMEAIQLGKSNPSWERLLGNYLAVIDLRNDPKEVYQFFLEIEASSIDLILPDCHHDMPPYRPHVDLKRVSYGKWLAEFFLQWYEISSDLEVKLFNDILDLILGGISTHESIGAKSVDIIVVDTDGSLEPVDTLKVVGREATDLGLNVNDASFDDALAHPAIQARMDGFNSLSQECKSCKHLGHCGGGYIPHRFSASNGFDNPSVYCEDLKHLFNVMIERIRLDLEEAVEKNVEQD